MTDLRIVTSYQHPPTPFPPFWEAHDDCMGADTSPIGRGATEAEAVEDLIAQLEETA